MQPLTPQRKLTLAGATAATLVALWFARGLLPVFFPSFFMESDAGGGGAPPPPTTTAQPTQGGPDTSAGGDDLSADALSQRRIDELSPGLKPESVAKDPIAALRGVARVVLEYPDAVGGKRAKVIADEIRAQYPKEVETANKAALDEIEEARAESAPRLEVFAHREVALVWQKLEERFAGLPAGEQANAERKRVQQEWTTAPRPEKAAHERFATVSAEGPDWDSKLKHALGCLEVATLHSQTAVGAWAGKRRDEVAGRMIDLLEASLANEPEQALDRAQTFPAELKASVSTRLPTFIEKATAECTRRARSLLEQIRAARAKGDFEGARGLCSKLARTTADAEKAAIAVHEAARAGRVRVDGGEHTLGPKGAEKTVTIKPFLIAKLEATARDYLPFVKETGAAPPRDWVDGLPAAESEYAIPVAGITQKEAAAYAAWLGGRLPTDQEWESAARGTDGRPYPWGRTWHKDVLQWHATNTRAPGSFPEGASPAGALDMAGNVAEWTATTNSKGLVAVKGASRREETPDAFHMGQVQWTDGEKRDSAIGVRVSWDVTE